MSIPPATVRVQLTGLAGTGEMFETGWWLKGVTISNGTDANTLAGQLVTIVQVNGSGLRGILNADSSWSSVKVYCYPTGGPTATAVGEAALTGMTGQGVGILPLQVAMVITLGTGLSGRRNRGRMYLPMNGAALVAGHLFATSVISAPLNSIANILNQWNSGAAPNGFSAVVSTAGTAAQKITLLTADQRPDIQRRRANKQSVGSKQTVVIT